MTSTLAPTTTHAQSGAAHKPPAGKMGVWRRFSWPFVRRNLLGSVATLLFILVVNFFLFRVINPHPERTLGRGRAATAEQLAEISHRLGLDQPLHVQFITYLKNVFTGDLGVSFKYNQPVSDLIFERLGPTLALVGTSTVLSVMIGLWIGSRAAWRRGGRFDRSTSIITVVVYSMPEWWLGLLLFMVFAAGIGPITGIFPIGGLHSQGLDWWSFNGLVDSIWHLVLPVTTLTLAYVAEYSIIMRSSMLDVMGQDYLQTARAKGLTEDQVLRRHAIPNAMLPVTTLVSLDLAFAVGGAITVETVFSIPGLGLLTTEALRIPDIPLLQGSFLVFSAAVVLANLVANFLYAFQDPRVKS
ncbi:ABC transporter permease [Mycobacteroides immunogenum]|nr:ABC transporter permease [Mycobacteroides immunogenum]ANO05589.1 ABC transporter permease [Mycobacteroides immunogenum]KIU41503.1 ABC transporter permease [Mycobacteroides immunogenum]ORV78039.1 ABC transporter permease [Mycobacteroides immunogenum]WJR32829.1 ABC transporter permease [Mycobacteroides immunogenum]